MLIHYVPCPAEAVFHKRAMKNAQRPFDRHKHMWERLRSHGICPPLANRNAEKTFHFKVLINKAFVNFLESQHLLSEMQYGFRHSRSAGDFLAYLTEHIIRVLGRQGESQSVALDICKMFVRLGIRVFFTSCFLTASLSFFTSPNSRLLS